MIITAIPDKKFISGCEKLMKNAPKMCERATRDAIKKAKTAFMDAKGGAPAHYNVKKSKDLAPYTRVSGDSMTVRSRLFTVGTTTHFSHTPRAYKSQKGIPVRKRPKASVTIEKKSKKAYPHGFVVNPAAINGGNTMLWERKGKKINPVRNISAAQMASNEEVYEYIQKEMAEAFDKRLEHYYDREVSRVASH